MDKLRKEKIIGSGTFGTVWLVKSKLSQTYLVMKEIDLNKMSDTERQRALTEVTVLAKLKHKNIIRYQDAVIDSRIGKLSILMEFADSGDLHTAILHQNGIPFKEDIVISWFIQICLALQYIHYHNILHRDLKTQNIFLTRNKVVKVGDFGIAKVLRNSEDLAITSIGTPYYLSPEICMRMPYNFKSDMWALGCILFEMSALEHPFKANSFEQLLSLIHKGRRKEFPSWCGPLVKELVQVLLNSDALMRPSADEVLANPGLQPYLSKYVFYHNSPEMAYLIDTRNLPTVEMSKLSRTICKKRTVSVSTFNAKSGNNLFVSDNQDNARSRSTSNASPLLPVADIVVKVNGKCISTYRVPSLKRVKLSESSTPMNTTYTVSKTASEDKCSHQLSNKGHDVDCGYQSEEVPVFARSDEKPKIGRKWGSVTRELASKSENQSNDTTGFGESNSADLSTSRLSDSEDHSNCHHTQCYQCMLYTLWKNRIKDNPNADEYTRLKAKLLKIFKDLFQKVYQSLLYDWEGNEIGQSRDSIRSFIKTLSYEQVQQLPLMMQLIQLEFQMRSMGTKERNELPSILL